MSCSAMYCLAGVWGILILASSIVFVLTRLKPQHDYRELVERTVSWWKMVGIFSIAILGGRGFTIVFLAFISFIALKEFFSIITTRRADRRILFWAYLAIPIQFYWAYIGWYGMFVIFIPVYMFLFIATRMVLAGETEGFLKSASIIQWGLMIAVFALSHTAFLAGLQPPEGAVNGGVGMLLFLVLLTEMNDIAQYVWGKTLGRRKVVPTVSPGKTWAGFIGGAVTTVILALLLYPFLTPFDLYRAAMAGAVIGIAGFLGDITVSAIKRDLGVKDTGAFIPGHGGILDRLDSLTYTAPLFFHFTFYFYY